MTVDFKALNDLFSNAKCYTDLLHDLPGGLMEAINQFSSDGERELCASTLLTCFSSVLVDVSGNYHGRTVFPMLYTAVVAPAASNKGIIDFGHDLLDELDTKFRETSRQDQALFKAQYASFKALRDGSAPPTKPPYKVVVLSSSITGPKLIEQLHDNRDDAPSIILVDEIDSVVNVDRGDFGGLSNILRSAYHHAKIGQQLKGNNQDYVVRTPKLAALIGGTQSQMQSLVGSAENGLYSRFFMVCADSGPLWSNVAPNSAFSPQAKFNALGKTVAGMFDSLRQNPLKVNLTAAQWEVINEFGRQTLGMLYNFENPGLAGVVKRHALMIFKLSMTLTAIRVHETGAASSTAICNDKDFATAYMLARRSLNYSVDFFKHLKGGVQSRSSKANLGILQSLENEFRRIDFVTQAEQLGIAKRTADRLLSDLLQGGILTKTVQGHYQKTDLAKQAKTVKDD